jgi:hypothetical protein
MDPAAFPAECCEFDSHRRPEVASQEWIELDKQMDNAASVAQA